MFAFGLSVFLFGLMFAVFMLGVLMRGLDREKYNPEPTPNKIVFGRRALLAVAFVLIAAGAGIMTHAGGPPVVESELT